MATFESLSDEILLIILGHVPHNNLSAISGVSKRLNRCVIPQLYRFVHLWEISSVLPPRFPDWTSRYHQSCGGTGPPGLPRRGDTRIYRLSSFFRTISESEVLRSYVTAASFKRRYSDQEGVIAQVVELLAPSLQYLHMAPAKYNPQATYLSTLTSLEIHCCHIGANYAMRPIDTDLFYSVFCIPTLDSLCLIGARCWDCFDEIPKSGRSRTSSITCLSFRDSVPVGPDLAEVLKWLTALRSFRYELRTDDQFQFGIDTYLLSATDFCTVLQPHSSTLEELLIHGAIEGDVSGYDALGLIALKEFPQLRRLGLPLKFMMVSQGAAEFFGVELEDFPSFGEVLSHSLEELQVEVSPEYQYDAYFSSKPPLEHFYPGELSVSLCKIARDKKPYCPVLQSLVVWQQVEPEYIYQEYQPCDLEAVTECAELLDAFRDARIPISWIASEEPPLFSALF